jgi:hypothetical protein
MKAFLWLLILFALGGTPAAHAGHDHYRGGHLALWLGVPPPIVAPGHLHGYPAYPRYRHDDHRHRHHRHGDSDSDSDSGHRHHRGCH